MADGVLLVDPFDLFRFCAQASKVALLAQAEVANAAYMQLQWPIAEIPEEDQKTRPVTIEDLPELVHELRAQGEERDAIAAALVAAAAALAYADGWDEFEFWSACQGGYKSLVAAREGRRTLTS